MNSNVRSLNIGQFGQQVGQLNAFLEAKGREISPEYVTAAIAAGIAEDDAKTIGESTCGAEEADSPASVLKSAYQVQKKAAERAFADMAAAERSAAMHRENAKRFLDAAVAMKAAIDRVNSAAPL